MSDDKPPSLPPPDVVRQIVDAEQAKRLQPLVTWPGRAEILTIDPNSGQPLIAMGPDPKGAPAKMWFYFLGMSTVIDAEQALRIGARLIDYGQALRLDEHKDGGNG